MTTLRRVARVLGREIAWWLGGGLRLAWRVKGRLLLAGLAALLVVLWGGWSALRLAGLPVLVVVVLLAVWARVGPVSFARRVGLPFWRWHVSRRLRRGWPVIMAGSGLSRPAPARLTGEEPGVLVPGRSRVRWDRQGLLHVTPRLLAGQTVDDVERVTDRLRTAAGADRLRVVPNHARTGCELVCTFGDPLAQPFTTPVPDPALRAVVPERLVLGLTENREPWTVDLRVCTLTAGSSGSGKGSVMWSLMLALAPAVRAGLVEVHGVDLKGGMELGLGRGLFTRYADRPDQAVTLLEQAVTACEQRASRMAGLSRLHTPTTAEPLVVVLVDELATLTAYLPDRDLLRRGEAALSRLCSIGRAPGFVVWGFLQDPLKETIKARHLFTQTIGLRLREREEVAMILGDGALAAGGGVSPDQPCHARCRVRARRDRPAHPRPGRLGPRRDDPSGRRHVPRTPTSTGGRA